MPKYNNYASAATGILGAAPCDSPSAKRKREEEMNVNGISAGNANGIMAGHVNGISGGNISSPGWLIGDEIDWFKVMFHGTIGERMLAGMVGSYQGNANGVHAMGAAGSHDAMTNLSAASKMKAMGREFASTNYQRDLGQLTPARPIQSMAETEPSMGSFASQMAGTMNSFQQSQSAAQSAFQQEQELKMKQLQEQVAAMSSMLASGNTMPAGAGQHLQQGAHHQLHLGGSQPMGTLQQVPQAVGAPGMQSPVVGRGRSWHWRAGGHSSLPQSDLTFSHRLRHTGTGTETCHE